jgi:hypothetical protein
MVHRHLNHERLTPAAIDDIISRGKMADWKELRAAALADRAVLERIAGICRAYIADPYAQRHHFWMHYANKHLA